ncbi:Cell wall-associated hydrolase [Arcanobacterium haemolyticum]|nr:Cell wall-associated hydrolase [Arcanobacterium haemolyticum]
MLLAEQLAHQRFVRPGPLVLGTALFKFPARAADRDRTVSRRSEPSSRAALMGEQPNPWDLLQPQDATSRHRGAKPCRRYELLGRISLLSRGTFYPLSDGASTSYRRITSSYFRTCSTCRSHSQAPLYTYTRHLIANQAEGTFERLRYHLGGNRPS